MNRFSKYCSNCLMLVTVLFSGMATAQSPSLGCSLDPPVPPVPPGQIASVAFAPTGAREGSYSLYLPEAYNPDFPWALVVGLHGWTGNGSSSLRGSGSDKSADALGYIAAWPDGVPYPQAGQGWAFPGCNASPPAGFSDQFGRRAVCDRANEYDCDSTTCPSDNARLDCEQSGQDFSGSGLVGCLYENSDGSLVDSTQCDMSGDGTCNWCGCVDDESFIAAVVEDIGATTCIDLDRVYLTGMSQGGMMTAWLYNRMGDVFAAFAPQSGTNPRDFHGTPDSSAAPGSVMFVHGTNDTIVPHDGSTAGDGFNYTSVEEEVTRMSEHAWGDGACGGGMQDWPVPDSVEAPGNARLTCRQCEAPDGDTREFVHCTFNGGHVWPKSPGRKESSLWGNRLMWNFFLGHCLNESPGTCSDYTPPEGDGGGGGGGSGRGCNPRKDPDCVK